MLLGLATLMLVTLPRYYAGGHGSHVSLMLIALAVVAVVTVLQWRQLPGEARSRLPALLRRLGFFLLTGLVVMSAWHALTSDFFGWELVLSHGATLGLLLHALWLWVRAPG